MPQILNAIATQWSFVALDCNVAPSVIRSLINSGPPIKECQEFLFYIYEKPYYYTLEKFLNGGTMRDNFKNLVSNLSFVIF